MKSFRHCILIALALCFLAACGTTAFTGRKQILMYSDAAISALADASYAEYMSTTKLSKNTSATKLVKTVGQKMVTALETYLKAQGQAQYLEGLSWDFKLVADTSVNAFCLPNGKIVLYDGIVKYANTADFLAVVIGHEMGHAVARHGNERMSQQALVASAGQIARSIFSTTNSGQNASNLAVFDMVFSVGSNLGVILPYSRKHEYEADQIGLYIMSLAGYNVYQAPAFWQKMSADGSGSAVDFMSTHPSDADRIANIQAVIAQMEKVK